jgi:hypothetical protein
LLETQDAENAPERTPNKRMPTTASPCFSGRTSNDFMTTDASSNTASRTLRSMAYERGPVRATPLVSASSLVGGEVAPASAATVVSAGE